MLRLLPKLAGPYFDFLVFPTERCWERGGYLSDECYHNPKALRVQDSIVHLFLEAFNHSHQNFNYFGPTEYVGSDVDQLHRLLTRRIEAISSYRTRKQFLANSSEYFQSQCDDDLGLWLPKWRRIRNELEIYGRQILHRVEQAQSEQKSLLVLGI